MGAPQRMRLSFWVLAGVVLVAGCTAGWVFRDSLNPGQTSSPPPSAPSSDGEIVAVCVGHVDLEGGTTYLNPLQPGVVAEIKVHETQEVPKGAVLLRLDDRVARLHLQEAEAGLKAAQKQLIQAQQLPEQLRLKTAQQKLAIEAAEVRLSAAQSLLARKQKLQKDTLINNSEVSVAQDQVKEAEILLKAEQEKLSELLLQKPLLAIDRAREDVVASKARAKLARYALDHCTLKAPSAGTVLRIMVNPGEIVSGLPQQPALLFAPHGQRVIRAEVEQEFVDQLAVGLTAQARDPRNIGPVWHGKVVRVSDWLLRRRSILQEPGHFLDVRTAECLISLESGQAPPRFGARLTVTLSKPKP